MLNAQQWDKCIRNSFRCGSSGSGGTMLRNEEWRGWTCFVFQWRQRCWSVATAGREMSLGGLMVLLDNDNTARQFSHQLRLSVQWAGLGDVTTRCAEPLRCKQSQSGFVMMLQRSSGCWWEEWREVVIAVSLPPRATEQRPAAQWIGSQWKDDFLCFTPEWIFCAGECWQYVTRSSIAQPV